MTDTNNQLNLDDGLTVLEALRRQLLKNSPNPTQVSYEVPQKAYYYSMGSNTLAKGDSETIYRVFTTDHSGRWYELGSNGSCR